MIIIVAYNKKHVIGREGKIPWHIPEDMRHFKETTGQCPVIVGRKTWDSLPTKPLPKRLNIVVSRDKHPMPIFYNPGDPMWASSLEDALRVADVACPGSDVYLIGGGGVYRRALEKGLVTKVIASEIDNDEDGDSFFPDLEQLGWSGQIIKEFPDFKVKEFTSSAAKSPYIPIECLPCERRE